MPTYQYKREDGTVFEVLQKINEEPLTTCPETGQEVSRIITGGAGVIYKGSGWYVTDYKRKEENGSSSNTETTSGSTSTNGENSTSNSNGQQTGSGSESTSTASKSE